MKETKIARQMLETYSLTKKEIDKYIMIMHKETCQRWLEFLEVLRKGQQKWLTYQIRKILDKEEDLFKAIKLYEEAGI